MEWTTESIAGRIDQTLLKPSISKEEQSEFFDSLQKYPFASACVPPFLVAETAQLLKDSNTKICTVVGFPLGHVTTGLKLMEAVQAMESGATEIDAVINLTWVKQEKWSALTEEVGQLALVTHMKGAILKVIIETGLLTESEIRSICSVCIEGEADYVKTSTGFNGPGATEADVKLIRQILPEKMKVKASGGIRDFETFNNLCLAGADRIGTSSGIKIIEYEQTN